MAQHAALLFQLLVKFEDLICKIEFSNTGTSPYLVYL